MAPVYMAFLRFMGDENEARTYSYSLEVGANGRKLIWEGTPRSIRDSHRKVRDSHDGLIIQRNMALFFSGGDRKELKLRVTGRIWKEPQNQETGACIPNLCSWNLKAHTGLHILLYVLVYGCAVCTTPTSVCIFGSSLSTPCTLYFNYDVCDFTEIWALVTWINKLFLLSLVRWDLNCLFRVWLSCLYEFNRILFLSKGRKILSHKIFSRICFIFSVFIFGNTWFFKLCLKIHYDALKWMCTCTIISLKQKREIAILHAILSMLLSNQSWSQLKNHNQGL